MQSHTHSTDVLQRITDATKDKDVANSKKTLQVA